MAGSRDLITAHELAERLNLSVETIWRYTREEKIPFVTLGRKQYRYRFDDVVSALSGDRVKEETTQYGSKPEREEAERASVPAGREEHPDPADRIAVNLQSESVSHQYASKELFVLLYNYFLESDPEGEVFFGPLRVELGEKIALQPDLFYISGARKDIIKESRVAGAPDLVVEVLSQESARRDRLEKMQNYQDSGVKHCWLLSPDEKTLECYLLHEDYYARVTGGMDDDLVEIPGFSGLQVALKNLWYKEG